MGAIESQINSLTIVFLTVYSDADQRKHQSCASLAFVWGIPRGPVNSPHKWPVTRKMFPFHDVIMISRRDVARLCEIFSVELGRTSVLFYGRQNVRLGSVPIQWHHMSIVISQTASNSTRLFNSLLRTTLKKKIKAPHYWHFVVYICCICLRTYTCIL